MFSEYTFTVNFLNRSRAFQCLSLVSFCAYRFLRVRRSRSCSITRDTDRRSIVSSCTITSLMFSSVRTDWSRPEPSFRPTSPVSSIIFNSFFTLFTFLSYYGWPWAILVAPDLYFTRKYLVTFSLYDNTISLVTNNDLKWSGNLI